MNICFFSPNFYPLVGGLENIAMDFANELSRKGHQVKVITLTKHNLAENLPFQIYRRPSIRLIRQIIFQSEVFLMFNLSLKGFLLWYGTKTPLFISHHTHNPDSVLGRIKTRVSNTFPRKNFCCSNFIAKPYARAVIIPNSFRNHLFKNRIDIRDRNKDIVFLGRLVSDKGADVLLKAIALLKLKAYFPKVSIIGNGPELDKLHQLTAELGIGSQVSFLGQLTGESLVDQLNQHRIMVVPSIWEEPFGIVALEGIACGCIIIGSNGGGLSEAIGKCGLTFPNGDSNALSDLILSVLNNFEENYQVFQKEAPMHLEKHLLNNVVTLLESEMTSAV